MLKSYVKSYGGTPHLFIDSNPVCEMAYTTYFEERSCYSDFVKAGYKIFFVNASMTSLPINSITAFTPFRVGVFEDMSQPNYSEFDDAVHKILSECPDAIIFPRIYVSMPKWWIASHPDDVVLTSNAGYREILFSDAFREDAKELLVKIVRYIKSADYAPRIGGWQICGGLTQEWFHHDFNGSLCKNAQEKYRSWVSKNYAYDNAELPTQEEYQYKGVAYNTSENARRYSIFCNSEVAETVNYLANAIKEETSHEQVVGTFYGYAYQSNGTPLFGTHGLRHLLDSENLDFFSSPNAYTLNRQFGIDWADMIPVDSIKHHGKLPFVECDIRTYLTDAVQKARPNEYPDDIYRTDDGKSVWAGPPTPELSKDALKKCFAHQLTKSSAIWWFDMWGGWYNDIALMSELQKMREIYNSLNTSDYNFPSAEVVFFADERGYANLLKDSPEIMGIEASRTAMGNTGAPYNMFMVEDAESILKNHTAAVFPFPIPSEAGLAAIELCEKMGVPYISATPEHPILTTEEIHSFLVKCGVHIYSYNRDVVYAGGGYVALHSSSGGEKQLFLPNEFNITPLLGASISDSNAKSIKFDLHENGTAIFLLSPINKGDV